MDAKLHKADLNIITGAIEGLNHYLYNFTQSAEEGSSYAKNIFDYVKKSLSKKDDLKYYSVPKGKKLSHLDF
jgi:DNA-dependent protein kinase catalytic subunit